MSDEARKAKREVKSNALKTLKEFADKSGNQDVVAAMKLIKPSLYGLSAGRSGGSSIADKFVAMVVERKQINEEEVFKVFKIGRKEAGSMIRKVLKKAEPAKRRWIQYNKEKGTYTFRGEQKDAPQGWEGFVPVETVQVQK